MVIEKFALFSKKNKSFSQAELSIIYIFLKYQSYSKLALYLNVYFASHLSYVAGRAYAQCLPSINKISISSLCDDYTYVCMYYVVVFFSQFQTMLLQAVLYSLCLEWLSIQCHCQKLSYKTMKLVDCR